LDVAIELGPQYLDELTKAAHAEKPGSAVVGEISGYPAHWFPSVDGMFNFTGPNLIAEAVRGNITGKQASEILDDMVKDAGIENLLRSWIHVDNHDTPRFASTTQDFDTRALVLAGLMTLPGSPVIYYGTELGMPGVGDPMNRAPMRWDLVSDTNRDYVWTKKLLAIRSENRALRIGDFHALRTNRLIGYLRSTDKVLENVIVLINPTSDTVKETFATRAGMLMSWAEMRDELTKERIRQVNGLMTITMPPKSVKIFTPVNNKSLGYSQYHRIP
jgi:glycosidase